MIELLASNRGGAKTLYPNSGPGPIMLEFGDEELGYFGTLTSAEMFTTTELSTHLDLGGSSYIDTPDWIKCFVNGRVLFTPTQRLKAGLSWNDLYKAGAIYGDDTNGSYPAATPVKQNAVITKGSYAFRIRVWGKDDVDPTPVASTNYPPGANHEYLKFCYKFFAGNGANFLGSWKLIPGANLLSSAAIQMLTAASNIANYAHFYWPNVNNGQMLHYAKTTSGTWWPVLEPVDFSKELLAIKTVSDQPLDDTLLSKIAITSLTSEVATEGDALKAISVNGLSYDTVAPKPVAITSLEVTADTDWPKAIPYSSIKQPTILSNIAITSLKYEA